MGYLPFIKLWVLLCLYCRYINSATPGQNGHHFTDNIFKYSFINEIFCILLWSLLRLVPKGPLTISQHHFRQWLGAEKATNHYLNKCWPSPLTHTYATWGGDEWKKYWANRAYKNEAILQKAFHWTKYLYFDLNFTDLFIWVNFYWIHII